MENQFVVSMSNYDSSFFDVRLLDEQNKYWLPVSNGTGCPSR